MEGLAGWASIFRSLVYLQIVVGSCWTVCGNELEFLIRGTVSLRESVSGVGKGEMIAVLSRVFQRPTYSDG